MFEGEVTRTEVSVINNLLEISLYILTIVATAGIIWGVIEFNFINLFGILWFISMNIITIIVVIVKEETEETTELEEE